MAECLAECLAGRLPRSAAEGAEAGLVPVSVRLACDGTRLAERVLRGGPVLYTCLLL